MVFRLSYVVYLFNGTRRLKCNPVGITFNHQVVEDVVSCPTHLVLLN